MFDAAVLSSLGYILIILSLFLHGSEHFGAKKEGGGCCKKGMVMTLLGFILLLLSVWV